MYLKAMPLPSPCSAREGSGLVHMTRVLPREAIFVQLATMTYVANQGPEIVISTPFW